MALALVTSVLSACSHSDTPSSNTSINQETNYKFAVAKHIKEVVIPKGKPAYPNWKGMTWRVLEQKDGLIHVGADQATNSIKGDTSAYAELPLLCVKSNQSVAPQGLALNKHINWLAGELKLTPAYPGSILDSEKTANRICVSEFGQGWHMANLPKGSEQISEYYAQGKLNLNTRFWVNNNNQTANLWNTNSTEVETKIPETTKVLGQLDRQNIVSVQENLLTIKSNSPLMTHLRERDIIVSESAPAAPEGFLRKVISIQKNGEYTNIQTEIALLEEAIENGELVGEKALSIADIDFEQSGEMIRAMHNEGMGIQKTKHFKLFDYSKNPFCLYNHADRRRFECDGGEKNGLRSKVPQTNFVTIDANLNAKANAYVGLKIKWFKVRNFNAGIEVNENASIKVLGKGKYSWDTNKDLNKWRIKFKTIKFRVGIVPVIIKPSLVPTLGTNGYIQSSLNYEVTQSFDGQYGVDYQRKRGWKGVKSSKFKFSSKFSTASAKAEAKAYVGLKAVLSIYAKKAGKVSLHGKAYGKAKANLKLKNRKYRVCTFYGFTADASARVRIISKKTWNKQVYNSGDKFIKCWGKK